MKEKEIIKLRQLQEKAADRQAEVDAIRAKRASEQADRLAREKEKRDAEIKVKNILRDFLLRKILNRQEIIEN